MCFDFERDEERDLYGGFGDREINILRLSVKLWKILVYYFKGYRGCSWLLDRIWCLCIVKFSKGFLVMVWFLVFFLFIE